MFFGCNEITLANKHSRDSCIERIKRIEIPKFLGKNKAREEGLAETLSVYHVWLLRTNNYSTSTDLVTVTAQHWLLSKLDLPCVRVPPEARRSVYRPLDRLQYPL